MAFVSETYLACDLSSLPLSLHLEGFAFVLYPRDQVRLELLFSPLPHSFLIMVEVFVAGIFLSNFACFLVLPILYALFTSHMLVISELSLAQLILQQCLLMLLPASFETVDCFNDVG